MYPLKLVYRYHACLTCLKTIKHYIWNFFGENAGQLIFRSIFRQLYNFFIQYLFNEKYIYPYMFFTIMLN